MQNGVFFGEFFGFLFMGIGMTFAYKPIYMPLRKAVTGFCVSMAFLLLEMTAVQYFGWASSFSMYVFLVPAVYFLFYLVTHIELTPNRRYQYLRNMSILIYCMHYFVYTFLYKGSSLLGKLLQIDLSNSLLTYVGTVLITCAASYIIIMLSNTKTFSWLKMLYS